MHYFRAYEHTSHKFFQISGFLANEYNIESPIYYFTAFEQLTGLLPYEKAASEIYIRESVLMELNGHIFNCLIILIGMVILL
jgi:hypothetical protein